MKRSDTNIYVLSKISCDLSKRKSTLQLVCIFMIVGILYHTCYNKIMNNFTHIHFVLKIKQIVFLLLQFICFFSYSKFSTFCKQNIQCLSFLRWKNMLSRDTHFIMCIWHLHIIYSCMENHLDYRYKCDIIVYIMNESFFWCCSWMLKPFSLNVETVILKLRNEIEYFIVQFWQ